MIALARLTQSRLSLLLLDKTTDALLHRVPVYAEVSASVELPPWVVTHVLSFTEGQTPVRQWLQKHPSLLDAIHSVMVANMAKADFDAIADPDAFHLGILEKLRTNLDDAAPRAEQKALVEKVVLQALRKLQIEPQVQPRKRAVWSHPLGTLASDHAGYLSFDLSHVLPNLKQMLQGGDPSDTEIGFFAYPLGREDLKVDLLEHARITPDAIFAKLPILLPADVDRFRRVNLPAMHVPGLEDWYLSPGSFTINPEFFIGVDGCETLFPANFATHEFSFFQVVRGSRIMIAAKSTDDGKGHVDAVLEVRTGWSLEYRVTWQPLGHTIGQIVYSLPLAPGEIVKIAVIDWARKSTDSRTEDLTVKEQLAHNTHRDRNISETVDAAMQEWQRGGSFMGGIAGSYGGGGYGVSGALGGGYSTSSGDRKVHAATVQQISDAFAQASSSVRELRSTIVVQSDQQERAKAETRVVANHNHSHALTMLYYEVLRHYKVGTQFMRLRPSLLVQYAGEDFRSISNIVSRRRILEAVLLDGRLLGCFDAVQRLQCLANEFSRKKDQLALLPNLNDVNELGDLKLVIKTKSATQRYPHVYVLTKNREKVRCLLSDPKPKAPNPATDATLPNVVADDGTGVIIGETSTITAFINYRMAGQENVFTVRPFRKVLWDDIGAIGIDVTAQELGSTGGPADPWQIDAIQVRTVQGPQTWVMLNSTTPTSIPVDGHQDFVILPYKEIPKDPSDLLTEEERCCIQRIMNHLSDNSAHYKKAIWLQEDPDARAKRFQQMFSGTDALIDLIENRPIDVLGDCVVFPARRFFENSEELAALEPVKLEKMMSLPTRGVFAEAKLGHCNASEEIDNTRFWDWQTSPITEQAPGIADLNLNNSRINTPPLVPTQLPSPIVNIVNPGSLPDPAGLASAMNVLGKADIFRDMSVSREVEDLLKNLSNNSVTMAQASNKAGSILQQRADAGTAGPSGGGGASSGGGATAKPNPSEQHDQLQLLRNAANRGDITTEQKNKLAQDYLQDATASKATVAFGIDAAAADAAAGAGASVQKELPAIAAPAPFAFLPVSNMPGPSQHPALMATCPSSEFFGDPPTRNQTTKGTVLTTTEVGKRKAEVMQAIAAAQADRPVSAAHLQHWLDATGSTLVLPAKHFKTVDSEVPSFLHGKARDTFESGCLARLKDKTHPQGTLLPTAKTVGSKGPVRFLQFRDGVRPSASATKLSADLFTALGSFNVHSALWVQATFKGTSGGVVGLFADDLYDVEILRWCVQIYDVYDWNLSAATPFLLDDAQLKAMPMPAGAVTVRAIGANANMVLIKDDYFRDLEVSGGGRAFLIRSDAFEAPSTAMGKFNIKI